MKKYNIYNNVIALIFMFVLLFVAKNNNNNIKLKKSEPLLAGIVAQENAVDGINAFNIMQTTGIANVEFELINNLDIDLSKYDVLYMDGSSMHMESFDKNQIQDYVKNGGNVFLDNKLYKKFDKEFIGAKKFVSLSKCPIDMEYPYVESNLLSLQNIIKDFSYIYKGYESYTNLSLQDYGVGIVPDEAISLAELDDLAIYTLNKYGAGFVFFSNPLLPNIYSVNNLSEENYGEALSISTVSANKLIRDYFLEFISINKYGYAIEHVYGNFAIPASSWQLHYEDITGIKNKSSIIFSNLLEKNGQIASFTIARSPYTWYKRAESVTYALSNNKNYIVDSYENVFSSGTHFVSDGKWLELDYYNKTISYFKNSDDYIKRAYPFPIDLDDDNDMDLIVGSADGKIYYYDGIGMKSNYELKKAKLLIDGDGKSISVGSYSSPVLKDIDNDGKYELITGNENGEIKLFKHKKNLVFEYMGTLVKTNMLDSMPALGDLNNDKVLDLAVGSRTGELRIYYGKLKKDILTFDNYVNVDNEESWISPEIVDLNNDGIDELFAGNQNGYIIKFKCEDGKYIFKEYIKSNKYNHDGNEYLRFGNNSVIRFYDINNDKKLDIVAGALEYGMAIPIDSEYFPYKKELQEQIDYLKEKNIYIGVHMLSSIYASYLDDKTELEYHKRAFDKYNISWDNIGVNQHTWNTSSLNENKEGFDGTYKAQIDLGLLWNNGSRTPNSNSYPENSAENTLTIPFYLNNGIMMMQPSNLLHGNKNYINLSLKYEVPLLFYYHCDFAYQDKNEQLKYINKVTDLLKNNNYNIIQEDQLAKTIAAVYNTKVDVKYKDDKLILFSKIKNKDISLYDERYQNSIGVKIVFDKEKNIDNLNVNANVYYKTDNVIYVSLDDKAVIGENVNTNKIHITSINLPAKVSINKDKANIEFLDGGMMQVKVVGKYTTKDKNWIIEYKNGITTFRKYGKKSSLNIISK